MALPVKQDFREIIEVTVESFVSVTRNFENIIMDTLAMMVKRAFEVEYNFISEGIECEKPDDEGLRRMADQVFLALRRIQECREGNRNLVEYSNHLATVAESILALGWITVPNTPVQYVRDMKEAGDYFGNRVLISNKGNEQHMMWIHKWNNCLAALEEYVRKHHRTGFSWNMTRTQSISHPVAPSCQAAPPPPPPPPSTTAFVGAGDAADVNIDRQALLKELNQGLEITRTLRPVNRDAAGNRGSVPAQSVNQSAQRIGPPVRRVNPVFLLEGRKWRVEFQLDELTLQLTPNDKSESLSMYKCDGSRLEVKGKMNAVTVDNCKRCIVVLQSIISSVELIRCEKVEVYCMGNCQSISLDYCDSVQIYLSDAASNCEVITSKCTSINICRLAQNGDYVEYPVPDQIKSKLSKNKLESTVVEHSM